MELKVRVRVIGQKVEINKEARRRKTRLYYLEERGTCRGVVGGDKKQKQNTSTITSSSSSSTTTKQG